MSSPPARRCPGCYAARWALAFMILTPVLPALAAPSGSQLHEYVRRDAGPAAVAIWIPILGAAAVVLTGSVIYFRNRSSRSQPRPAREPQAQTANGPTLATRIRTWSSRPVTVPGVTVNPQTRELTAEQLAGGGAPGRRPRRGPGSATASMRSTRSLPLYMKEPGEEEVVVIRAQAEIDEDGGIRASVLLPPVQEGQERTPPHSIDLRRTSTSSFARPDMPLLEGQDGSNDADRQDSEGSDASPQPAFQSRGRASLSTIGGGSSEAEEPLMNQHHDEYRSRGPAPPYVEASVSIDSGVAFNESTDDGHGTGTSSIPMPTSAQRSTNRRSGLFSRSESSAPALDPHNGRLSHLLHLFQPGQRQSQHSNLNVDTEANADSSTSPAPDSPQRSPQRRRPRGVTVAGTPMPTGESPYRTHRPTNSSASALSAMFRTRSNTSMSGTRPGTPRDRLTSPSMISLHSISSPLTHTVVRTEYTYPRTGPTPEQMKFLASVDSFKRFGVPYGPDAVAYAATASRLDLSQPPPVFEEVDGGGRTAGENTGGEGGREGERTGEESGSGSESESPTSSSQAPQELTSSSDSQPQPAPAEQTENASGVTSSEQPEESGAQASSEPPPAAPVSTPAPLTAEDVKKILRAPVPPTSYKTKAPLSPLSSARPGSRASSHATFATAEESLSPGSPDTATAETAAKPEIMITDEDASTPIDDASNSEPATFHAEADAEAPKADFAGASFDASKADSANAAMPVDSPRLSPRPIDDENETTTAVPTLVEVPPV